MTLQQEAYRRIDQLSDDGLRILIDMIDKIRVMSLSGFKDTMSDSVEVENISAKPKDADLFPIRPVVDFPQEDANTKRLRADKKKKFLASAGKVDIDEEAIREFRERSMV
ncbi:MAG: hypothetical protein IJ682_09435 [Lachnospiraceae bacterium]|nr:hypothetical protein [Lachnospiraceae bacterium]